MIFTSYTFIYFYLIIATLYWVIGKKEIQNSILLIGSYLFYGWVTPWFCLMIASSTVIDYCCGRGMDRFPVWRKKLLLLSLLSNLGLLGVFKYYNFFVENFLFVFSQLGMSPHLSTLQIVLPVGISFYTFQTLSYTIDIYRRKLTPRKNFIDFALFVSFFPQLVAGPIERAVHFLPQIERTRNWSWSQFERAIVLIVRGYFKKLVIADNIVFYVDKIFMLESPGFLLLAVGTLAFSVQIYADFSGYTDIARGTAKLLGFHLLKNFNFPYLAISPSDFWRRWHASLSTWIRDYLYIPLGGSQQKTVWRYIGAIMLTMFLCGLWHGAAWNYVVWGVYHGILLVLYRMCGLGGKWRPGSVLSFLISWSIMYSLILIGWSVFRAPSMTWWFQSVSSITLAADVASIVTAVFVLLKIGAYVLPLLLLLSVQHKKGWGKLCSSFIQACLLIMVVIFHSEKGQDFIYFQF